MAKSRGPKSSKFVGELWIFSRMSPLPTRSARLPAGLRLPAPARSPAHNFLSPVDYPRSFVCSNHVRSRRRRRRYHQGQPGKHSACCDPSSLEIRPRPNAQKRGPACSQASPPPAPHSNSREQSRVGIIIGGRSIPPSRAVPNRPSSSPFDEGTGRVASVRVPNNIPVRKGGNGPACALDRI